MLEWRAPRAWDLEPRLARQVFEGWVRQDRYRLHRGGRVERVERRGGRIVSIRLTSGATLAGSVFIDASYEGDLMARAGVRYTWGRESVEEYNEQLAGVRGPHFVANHTQEEYATPTIAYMHHGQFGADIPARSARGRLLWGVEPAAAETIGSADRRVQAYYFRLIATQRQDLKLPWPKPRNYRPERYELLRRYIQQHPNITFTRLVHLGAIPNGKFDLNASGPFSTDYIGGNRDYPDGNYAVRDRIWRDHEDYQKGFLWFLANDPRLPRQLREEAASWGLAKDGFAGTGNWPVQLYIREARRMIGSHVMTGHDILREKSKDDSVGLGSFVLDSHWVRRFENSQGFVRVEGHLDESINLSNHPYEIAYRSLTPRRGECANLLVPVCLSATHVALCTIRMEPVSMILGHAAGVAAALAAKSGNPVQEIDIPTLLGKLRRQASVLKRTERRRAAPGP